MCRRPKDGIDDRGPRDSPSVSAPEPAGCAQGIDAAGGLPHVHAPSPQHVKAVPIRPPRWGKRWGRRDPKQSPAPRRNPHCASALVDGKVGGPTDGGIIHDSQIANPKRRKVEQALQGSDPEAVDLPLQRGVILRVGKAPRRAEELNVPGMQVPPFDALRSNRIHRVAPGGEPRIFVGRELLKCLRGREQPVGTGPRRHEGTPVGRKAELHPSPVAPKREVDVGESQ